MKSLRQKNDFTVFIASLLPSTTINAPNEDTNVAAPRNRSDDRKLLQELAADARLPVAKLSRRIGLSPSATAERVRRLESLEVIQGYRAEINFGALGFSITAFVRLTCEGPRYKQFLKILPSLDPIQECHHLTGNDTFLLKVLLPSVAEFQTLLEKLLNYGNPTTSMVLSTPLVRKHPSLLNKKI